MHKVRKPTLRWSRSAFVMFSFLIFAAIAAAPAHAATGQVPTANPGVFVPVLALLIAIAFEFWRSVARNPRRVAVRRDPDVPPRPGR